MIPPAEGELFLLESEVGKSTVIFHTFSYPEASWGFIFFSPTELISLRVNNKKGQGDYFAQSRRGQGNAYPGHINFLVRDREKGRKEVRGRGRQTQRPRERARIEVRNVTFG